MKIGANPETDSISELGIYKTSNPRRTGKAWQNSSPTTISTMLHKDNLQDLDQHKPT